MMVQFLDFLLSDPVFLARVQFAFTVSFHIIFPAFTIGLASWLVVVEGIWLTTKKQVYADIYRMWVKIFAVCFGLGVVSGLTLSYQLGTNWSVFSDQTSNVIGPLLAFEVLGAFFLEASFLGIMLFGINRVSKRMHFLSTLIVALGTIFSAFWILAANSWMQTPQGFFVAEDGRLFATDWLEVIFNPSFPYRFTHMLIAAYLTTAFMVGGVAAWYLYCKTHLQQAKIMFAMAMLMATVAAPIQLLVGHEHGANTMEYQPTKIAAMEGNWERGPNKPLYLFGLPNEETQTTDAGIKIPGGASWILTGSVDGVIPGLLDVPKEQRPPVAVVFWSFRIMVGIGIAMILTGIMALLLLARRKLFESKPFQLWCILMAPSGFFAVLAGWFVTEVGRQPYTVYNVLLTSQSASPSVISEQIAITLLVFIVVYTFIFGAGIYYILKLIGKGPVAGDIAESFYSHSRLAHNNKKKAT